MPKEIEKRIRAVARIALANGWTYLGCNDCNYMISFLKDETRLNIYVSTMTVSTALSHPVKGKTQLHRKNVSISLLRQILHNPRKHTCLGYYNKKGKKIIIKRMQKNGTRQKIGRDKKGYFVNGYKSEKVESCNDQRYGKSFRAFGSY